MRKVLGLLGLVLVSGCTATAGDDVRRVEQRGTAGQDIEVARLRNAFQDAKSPLGALEAKLLVASSSAAGTTNVWQCGRRDAGLDVPPHQTATTFAFRSTGDGEVVAIDAVHAGAAFLRDGASRELVGHSGPFFEGQLGVYSAVRVAANGDLLVEEFLRPTVALLSDAGATTYDHAQRTHEESVVGQGPALAYTRCSSRQIFAEGRRVALFDDFDDSAYTTRLWGSGANPGGGFASLYAWVPPARISAPVEGPVGKVELQYLSRSGTLVVTLGGFAVLLGDQGVSTVNGATAPVAVPTGPAVVSIELQQGVVVVVMGGQRVELSDWAASPVGDGRSTSLDIGTDNSVAIDKVSVSLP